jgi:hypothetical protein
MNIPTLQDIYDPAAEQAARMDAAYEVLADAGSRFIGVDYETKDGRARTLLGQVEKLTPGAVLIREVNLSKTGDTVAYRTLLLSRIDAIRQEIEHRFDG